MLQPPTSRDRGRATMTDPARTGPTPAVSLRSHSPEATERLGAWLGRYATPGLVVALVGEMGAGKTTFVRGLARGLEVEEPVTSPTFTLMQEHEGRLSLWHLDAWMAAREEAFLEAGGADLLGADGVAAVEWAEHVADWLPRPRLELRLELRPAAAPAGAADGGPPARALRLALVPAPPGPAGPDPREAPLRTLLDALAALQPPLEGLERLCEDER